MSFNQNLLHYSKTAILAVSLVVGLSYLQAWTGPLSTPPDCTTGNPGCDAPINASNSQQSKSGNLLLTSLYTSSIFTDTVGSVGIGTLGLRSPSAKLDVEGEIKIGITSPTPLACSATTAGALRYNGTSRIMEYCDSTAWRNMGSMPSGSYTSNHPGGMTANAYCQSIGGYCSGIRYFSGSEWFPRGCESTIAGGKIDCTLP